jgi:alpha-1,4-digalacturonate transport system substrate-binding protein
MKSKFLWISIFMLLIGSLVFGQPNKDVTAKKEATTTKELTALWFYDDPSELDFLNKKIAEYSASHPGITIKVNTVAYDDLFPRLTQLVAGNNPPDIVKLTDIRPEIAPFILNLSQYFGKDFLKPFIPGVAAALNRDGKIMGAPLDVTANGIILNKSLFDKAGIAIPSKEKAWTYKEFLDAISTVKAKTGVLYGLVWDVTPHRWSTYLFQNGGSFFDATGRKSNFNSPAAIQSLRGFADMFENGYIPKSIWIGSENPRDIFFSGQAVAWMSGSWQIKAMLEKIKNFEWTAGPNPYVTTRSSVLGYKFVSAFSTSKYPDVAADFIKFFTSKENNSEYAQSLTTIASRTDTGIINYGNAQASSALNNLAYELAISPLSASTDIANPVMGYIWTTLKENVIAVLTKTKTSEQAAADVNNKIEESIKVVYGN